MADIAPITRRVATGIDNDDSETPTPVTLIEAIEGAEGIDGLRDDARTALHRFASTYRDLLTESQGQTLVETCRSILDRTGAWQDIEALPPNSRLTARLNIYRLLDLAEEWSPLKGRPSVGAFLDYLKAMEDEPADELDSARLSGEDAVTLVTVHRAKGLEWENVAIPAVTKGNFPSRSQQFPDPIRFADHVPVEMRIDSLMDDLPDDRKERDTYMRERHMVQEWRVAYVALTRAKKRLFLSGAHWYGLPEPSKNPKEPSELFDLVKDGGLSAGEVELTERPILLRPPVDVETPDPLFESGWAGAVRSALADSESMRRLATELEVGDEYERIVKETRQRLFELAEPSQEPGTEEPPTVSVTGLVTYAQCPKRFYWSDVDPLPRRPNPAATRGTEVHRRIELHQRGQVPFDEVSETLYDVPDGPGGGSKGAYETYAASRFAGARASLIEVPFTLGLETGFRVRGRIDAVYVDPPVWEVVDFKSGRPSDDPSRIVQLQAYAVAVDAVEFGPPKPEEVKVTFAYLGDGLAEVSYDADPEWVDEARRSLEGLTRSIADSQYEEQPGPWCGSCDFLQFCAPGQAETSS
jgi:DNA helicase-2/ATP-dependent DNA helicase PcrA